eukprot:TRINITY_DN731_c0_g1_i4.p1 TRINITY_DN731_c0_g1~~TRINITY_DN731_c0_g1_i4.p1  ORF type:complete len:481 (+),score=92.75 TRINITY_DN731_c0_g1_i4:210-1652(+)
MQNFEFFLSAFLLLSGCNCQFRTFASSSEELRGTVIQEVDSVPEEGTSPGKVVVERVVAYPVPGNTDEITLRNIGGQTVDLTGWALTDNNLSRDQYILGQIGCEDQAVLKPGYSVIIYPYSVEEPCGFDFGISFVDEINLFNAQNQLEDKVTWSYTSRGVAIYKTEEGQHINIPEGSETVVGVLSSIPDFSYLLYALKFHGLYEVLQAPSDPYNLVPFIPQPPEPNYFQMITWPWWFGYARDFSEYPVPEPPASPPPAIVGIPELGPFTLLAPTNKAFETAKRQMTGGSNVPMSLILEQPEMRTVLEYHILAGGYSSAYMFNNTPIATTQGQDIFVVRDAKQIEGTIGFMDTCIDKPTPDKYTCEQQKEFGKCFEPFMMSPLSAQWQGGFCERTCGRCSCDRYPCVKVEFADMMATNGVIHSIDRLMFPAPVFEKELPPPTVEQTDVESENYIKILQENIGVLPSLPSGLPVPLGGRRNI